MTCPLCAKLNQIQPLPADELVWQFPHSIAILGPWQYYTGYCVLIARSHATELYQLAAPERAVFLAEMVLLSEAIATAFQPRKLNCESLGNQVPHLHWHLFPRSHDDPDTLKPVWLALDRADRDEAEKLRLQTASISRVEIAERLRATLTGLVRS